MRYALQFLVISVLCAVLAQGHESPVASVPLYYLSLIFLVLGLGYAFIGPGMFMKRPNGSLPLLSTVVFLPIHLLNQLVFRAYRAFSSEDPFNEIVPGLFLGRRLAAGDEEVFSRIKVAGVLDLTGEFPEHGLMTRAGRYRCIRLLDGTPPSASELREGVGWVDELIKDGGAYVHCAVGHGRSATFVAAYLLATRKASTPEEAEALIKEKRPGVGLNASQKRSLHAFHQEN